ncbi:MAG: HEAT repeat domain-containing protein [Planctomycetes bacterium]|nr:HEAT repeat domain-containing protein [Planctomycetota bacterium]
MGNEEAKHLGVLSSVSKCAGPSIGTTAAVGKKTTGTVAGGLAGAKHLLARPVDEELDIDLDEQSEPAFEPELETQSRCSEDDESADIVTRLEANLTKTRGLLAEMQEQAEKTKSELSAQITDLQTQRDSLIFDLEQTTKEVNDSKSIEATLRARVTALESELDAAKGKSEKPRNPVIHAKPQLLSEAEIDQAGQELQLYKQKQDEIAGTVEQNQEISEKISHPEGDVKVEKTIDEQLPQPLVDEPEVSVLEDVDVAETEQVELPQQQEVESSIETTTVQSDEQEQAETEIEEFIPTTAVTEASVLPDVTFEEAKTADFTSVTEKIIFIKALSDINSHDEATRINAVKTMGGIHHEFSVRTLAAQMTSEPEAQIRAECIKALAALNMKEGLPAIERALTEQAVSVRLAAVRGLYRLAGAESAPALVRMLCDEDADVRRRTATCIRWLGKEDLAVELVPLLDDSSVSVRRAAVEAMGNLRNRKVVSDLIEHLSDPEKRVCRAITAALKTITGKEMSETFPIDEKSFRRLVARWQQWWKDESKVLC